MRPLSVRAAFGGMLLAALGLTASSGFSQPPATFAGPPVPGAPAADRLNSVVNGGVVDEATAEQIVKEVLKERDDKKKAEDFEKEKVAVASPATTGSGSPARTRTGRFTSAGASRRRACTGRSRWICAVRRPATAASRPPGPAASASSLSGISDQAVRSGSIALTAARARSAMRSPFAASHSCFQNWLEA